MSIRNPPALGDSLAVFTIDRRNETAKVLKYIQDLFCKPLSGKQAVDMLANSLGIFWRTQFSFKIYHIGPFKRGYIGEVNPSPFDIVLNIIFNDFSSGTDAATLPIPSFVKSILARNFSAL